VPYQLISTSERNPNIHQQNRKNQHKRHSSTIPKPTTSISHHTFTVLHHTNHKSTQKKLRNHKMHLMNQSNNKHKL